MLYRVQATDRAVLRIPGTTELFLDSRSCGSSSISSDVKGSDGVELWRGFLVLASCPLLEQPRNLVRSRLPDTARGAVVHPILRRGRSNVLAQLLQLGQEVLQLR